MQPTSAVEPILEAMYKYRREMVPCFIGAPGIGKTQGLYRFAEKKGVNVVTFILSNTVPSEVSGIRMPDQESKKMEVFDDMRMASLKDGDILFFDEILEAPPVLWSACLTLIQDRIMASGRKLPDVFIVAASNKVVSPGIIPASTRDRFQFIELRFDFDDWKKYMERQFGIDVPTRLRSRIQEESSTYNILTPRRVTKLVTWLRTLKDEDEKWLAGDVIRDMFDSDVMDIIVGMANSKATVRQQIKEALIGADIELPEGFDDMPLKDLLEILQMLPEWEKISEVLSSTQVE
jgi:MoxR-like ATPase